MYPRREHIVDIGVWDLAAPAKKTTDLFLYVLAAHRVSQRYAIVMALSKI